jgi:hypothetical protein
MKLQQHWLYLCLACLALSLNATAQTSPSREANTRTQLSQSTVSGHAVFEDTHEAATRERITLIASEYLDRPVQRLVIPSTVTDEHGDFDLKAVATGEYFVVPIPADQHQPPADEFPFLNLLGETAADDPRLAQFKRSHIKISVDGQNSLTLNLSVWNPHYGRISGQVFDSDGKPAVHSSVHLIPQQSGSATLGQSMAANGEGKYTFHGLAPGDYVIGASPPLPLRDVDKEGADFQGLSEATTYYPSTLQAEQAVAVTVLADRENANIDIRLAARPLHNISGMVRWRDNGDPITAARVQAVKKGPSTDRGNGLPGSNLTSVDAKGNWSFSNLPDGAYQVVVEAASKDQQFVAAEQTVEVAGRDVSDIAIEVSRGIRIAGTIVIEGADHPVSLSVMAVRPGSPAQTFVNVNPVASTNEFVIVGAPDGRIMLTLSTRPSRPFYVKSIEARGKDLLSEQLEASEGDEITGVHIVISPEVVTLNGRIVSSSGAPVTDGLVTISPTGKRCVLGGQPSGRTDDKGNFSLTAPPGEYQLQVLRTPVNSQFGQRQSAAVLVYGPAVVTLQPGDNKTLSITIHQPVADVTH